MDSNLPEKMDFKEIISAFTIPVDIRDDLIYVQKCLRQYLRLHKIIASRLGYQSKYSSNGKKLIQLEREICEIAMDQNILTKRLRAVLEEYYNSLRSCSVVVDVEIGNAYIARQLSRCLEDPVAFIAPLNVKKRYLGTELLSRYNEILENLPTPDELKKLSGSVEHISVSPEIPSLMPIAKQVSLLKPKSERFALQKNPNSSDLPEPPARKILLSPKPVEQNEKFTRSDTDSQKQRPSINTSRLNLLQALNKARDQSLALVQKNVVAQKQIVQTPPTGKSHASASSARQSPENDHNLSPPSVASDDSLDARSDSPNLQEDIAMAENDQEVFMRLFGLYTQEYSGYLSQRRSKRKRRTVQRNEKSDFHYSRYDMYEQRLAKKKRTFLKSPTVAKNLKRKKSSTDEKGPSTSKSASIDRSSSSSPEQNPIVKKVCNQCNRINSKKLLKCLGCTENFHLKCHSRYGNSNASSDYCPRCYRKLNPFNPELRRIVTLPRVVPMAATSLTALTVTDPPPPVTVTGPPAVAVTGSPAVAVTVTERTDDEVEDDGTLVDMEKEIDKQLWEKIRTTLKSETVKLKEHQRDLYKQLSDWEEKLKEKKSKNERLLKRSDDIKKKMSDLLNVVDFFKSTELDM